MDVKAVQTLPLTAPHWYHSKVPIKLESLVIIKHPRTGR
jgi:hypothetical protein